MTVLLARCIIIYILVIAGVRLMGKRQIGDLQPSDLVITILLSEVAAMPLQDNDMPLINSIAAVSVLVSIEIIVSYLAMKLRKVRTALDGNAVLVIKDGELDVKQLKKLRFTVEDLMAALRLKDVFDIGDVSYAYVETNGSLSVLLKKDADPGKDDGGLPCLVVSDGKIIRRDFSICGMTDRRLCQELEKRGLSLKQVLLMTAAADGSVTVIEDRQPQMKK